MGVATEDSLKQSMDKAVSRYPSLFRLPSIRRALSLLPFLCVGCGLLSALVVFPSLLGLYGGLLLGGALFATSLFADHVTNRLILPRGTIFNFRRTVGFSLVCWALWFFFVFVGVVLAVTAGLQWWIRLCLLGFSAVMILRLVVVGSIASVSYKRILAVSLIQPFLCVVPFLIFWVFIGYSFTFYIPAFFLFSTLVALASTLGFLHLLDRLGQKMLRLHSLSLFKAFMLNWVLGLNAPFEDFLEKLGEERNVEVSLVKFGSSGSKAIIVIPSVHPGPFKNIGSSLLPSLLKANLEEKLNCVACVPHGLLGHEFDLASQLQNQKIIADVVQSLKNFELSDARASPFVKVSNGLATACCQIFGKSAFISFTLAPRTIEDLPEELGQFVNREAEKYGLQVCAVINAHNSINGKADIEESLGSLKDVATKCLEKAASMKRLPFQVGSATVLPKGFSLEDGMGSGGITVIVLTSGGQKAAYVVIDGNNMVSGLRERILSLLKSIGIDDGEILTTDTHSVSALVLNGLGYHPVGEVMDNEKLLSCVKELTVAALANSEDVKVSCRNIVVPNVKVIGAKQLETLCILVEKGIQLAKRAMGPIFVCSGLLLMLFLLLV
jgi:putative membrane protein